MRPDERLLVPTAISSRSIRAARSPRLTASSRIPQPVIPPPTTSTSNCSAARVSRSCLRASGPAACLVRAGCGRGERAGSSVRKGNFLHRFWTRATDLRPVLRNDRGCTRPAGLVLPMATLGELAAFDHLRAPPTPSRCSKESGRWSRAFLAVAIPGRRIPSGCLARAREDGG